MNLEAGDYYLEHLSDKINSYELKMFRVQHEETQLTRYLVNMAKKHERMMLNKTYLVRDKNNRNLVAWFSLKNATLPYNDKESSFLIPAIELTHFAVDERYKTIDLQDSLSVKTCEFIFWNLILPVVKYVSEKVACKDLFVFSINTPKLISYYKNRLGFQEIENIATSFYMTQQILAETTWTPEKIRLRKAAVVSKLNEVFELQ